MTITSSLPLSIEGFNFDILDNPRESDYVLGKLRCDVCECQTSMYLTINGWNDLRICKGCLTNFIDALNNRMLDLCKGD